MAASVTKRTDLSLGNVKGEAVLVDMDGDASFAFRSKVAVIKHVLHGVRDSATNTEAVTYSLTGNQITVQANAADNPDVDFLILGE